MRKQETRSIQNSIFATRVGYLRRYENINFSFSNSFRDQKIFFSTNVILIYFHYHLLLQMAYTDDRAVYLRVDQSPSLQYNNLTTSSRSIVCILFFKIHCLPTTKDRCQIFSVFITFVMDNIDFLLSIYRLFLIKIRYLP